MSNTRYSDEAGDQWQWIREPGASPLPPPSDWVSPMRFHGDVFEALTQALEYFEDREDVKDGSYGEPSPNREMSLAQLCRDAILNLEAHWTAVLREIQNAEYRGLERAAKYHDECASQSNDLAVVGVVAHRQAAADIRAIIDLAKTSQCNVCGVRIGPQDTARCSTPDCPIP